MSAETSSLKGGLTFGTSCGPYDGRQEARDKKAAAPAVTDFFGDPLEPAKHAARLSLEWTYPPFSVLNARDGWWQERKREWLALGIQSELGRGELANDAGASAPARTNDAARMQARHKANAIPGGAPMPLDRKKQGGAK